jgi:hypothetical protein
VSDFVESAVVMLNPLITSGDGEWEGWDFGNDKAGANRYRSFEQMMVALRANTVSNLHRIFGFDEGQALATATRLTFCSRCEKNVRFRRKSGQIA